MATARFAAAEARIAVAAFKHLTNVMAVLDSVDVPVIFDRTYIEAFTGIASSDPRALIATSLVATSTTSSMLVIGADTFRLRKIQAVAPGFTLLDLELQ